MSSTFLAKSRRASVPSSRPAVRISAAAATGLAAGNEDLLGPIVPAALVLVIGRAKAG